MVQRLPRFSPKILMLAALLVAARDGGAQQSATPPKAPVAEAPKKLDSPPVEAPKISKHELERRLTATAEMVFGKDSAAVTRSVRLWLPSVQMLITAKEATVGQDGTSVRFANVSLGFPNEKKALHGTEGVVMVDERITEIDQLSTSKVFLIELQNKNGVVTLTPLSVNGKIASNKRIVETRSDVSPAPDQPRPAPPVLAQAFNAIGIARPFDIRFNFKIDSQAPLTDLLPSAAITTPNEPHPFNEDLTKVAEIGFGKPMAKGTDNFEATEAIAHTIAKINHLNAKKHDGFMLAMIENGADLRGLPFLMGDDCRSSEPTANMFRGYVQLVHLSMQHENAEQRLADLPKLVVGEWGEKQRAVVATMMQILMPASEQTRIILAKSLTAITHVDATKALARLAIFSSEEMVRAAAIDGLRLRSERDYTDILMQGFNYPLPSVANRSAEALVKLGRKDVLADLVDVLDRPDPRLPVAEKREGKDVMTVRELVKVNHHRNCLLCHAPGNTENTPTAALKVAVPLPVEPLPKPTDGGYQTTPSTPDILVRIDMTYLRQDFSLMMPVADAHPWPEMQRFDFLVRTRQVTPAEVQAFESRREADEPGRPSVYHRAALFALRELSGRDAEATPQAWRKLLSITKRS